MSWGRRGGSFSTRVPRRGGRSKYAATPTLVDGIRFDSKKEARRYTDLRLMEMAGEIGQLERQPSFELHAVNPATGEIVTLGSYRADFRYRRLSGVVVEDVKGFKTPIYRWKKRHVEAQYGIQILET